MVNQFPSQRGMRNRLAPQTRLTELIRLGAKYDSSANAITFEEGILPTNVRYSSQLRRKLAHNSDTSLEKTRQHLRFQRI